MHVTDDPGGGGHDLNALTSLSIFIFICLWGSVTMSAMDTDEVSVVLPPTTQSGLSLSLQVVSSLVWITCLIVPYD